MIGGVAGAAIAAGPLIGGYVTTTWSWRLVFLAEDVIVIAILLFRRRMKQAPAVENPPKLDYVGAALSAAGLGLVVFGILKSSDWGWVQPQNPPSVNGHEITPFGFSPVPFLIMGGLALLGAFWLWLEHRDKLGQDALLDRALLKIVTLRAGLTTLLMQQLILLGVFFVLPVYLQVVLGLDAFETGKRLFPMSISMLLAALLGPRMAARRSPRRTAQVGLGGLVLGSFVLLGTIDVTLNTRQFSVGLAIFGIGAGLLISQLGNVIMSSVSADRTNEAGGLQGTAQNLGASLGTALIGAVLLTGLTNGFIERVQDNPALPQRTEAALTEEASQGLDAVPVEQVEAAARDAGLPPGQAAAVADAYGEAELDGLRNALGAVAVFGLLAFWPVRRLPGRPLVPEGAAEPPAAIAPTS